MFSWVVGSDFDMFLSDFLVVVFDVDVRYIFWLVWGCLQPCFSKVAPVERKQSSGFWNPKVCFGFGGGWV